MFGSIKLKSLFTSNRITSVIFRDSFSLLTGIFAEKEDASQLVFRQAFQSLVLPMLQDNGRFSESKKTVYRRLLEEQFDRVDAERHLSDLNSLVPLTEQQAVRILQSAAPERSRSAAEFLLALAVALDETSGSIDTARRIALAVNISEEQFSTLYKTLRAENERKKRLVSSGHGILAVLVIIAVFVLVAKFLQSVIFGLILAALLLPLEKFIERCLHNKRGLPYWLWSIANFFISPLCKLSSAISKKPQYMPAAEADNSHERGIVRSAVVITALSALLITALACWGIGALTSNYMKDVQKKVQIWEARNQASGNDTSTSGKINYFLNHLQGNFRGIPIVSFALNAVEKVINDPASRAKAMEAILKQCGGFSGFATGMVNVLVTIASDILLTIFFALLFLLKMAEFCQDDNSDRRKSEYLVRSFFNGIWLPGADESVIQEARRIIEGIFFRLRVWLKGYLTLILIDSTVYTTCFFFIGVPFFLPLGVLAGCGIVLPYLGPVLSCGITLLVTIAAGEASGGLLLTIIICYLIYNGIIEQFILYPAVIGSSLGLNTLETIVVVLIGAIFAGIPGMILALPTASVAKYIIPQIYRGLIKKEPQG